MSRSHEYMQGRREAIKWAITWLHARANQMNDPHAKGILDTAANDIGALTQHDKLPTPPRS